MSIHNVDNRSGNVQQIENNDFHLDNMFNSYEEKLATAEKVCSNQKQIILSLQEKNAILEKELSDLKENYLEAIQQQKELQQQLNSVQSAYDVIANAAFWKITKPLRVTLDAMKKIPMIHILVKGVKYCAKNGIRYTLAKVREKVLCKSKNNMSEKESIYNEIVIQNLPIERTIKFSILVPLYNTAVNYFQEMVQSVLAQTYDNWELCLVDGSDASYNELELLANQYAEADSRIKYKRLEKNLGISEGTNQCAMMATGDYLALLDHDDILMPYALIANAQAIMDTGADVLYSDEDHLSAGGQHVNPLYKPDWSIDLLHSQMYICHFLVFKRDLFFKAGKFNPEFDGAQDYDLMLRFSEMTNQICHISEILYSWRETEQSTSVNSDVKPYAHDAGRKALDQHLKRIYGQEAYASDSDYSFVYDARFPMEQDVKVSIIIPMRDQWMLTDDCVHSILSKSSYQNYEILILDNSSEQLETKEWLKKVLTYDKRIKVLQADMDFNWSAINNFGVECSDGDVLIFLNNDTLVISNDWIERLCEHACRKEVGVVGPLLLYPDDTIQHAGVVVGMGGWADHIYRGTASLHNGTPYISPMVSRNVLGVTGACMAISRETLYQIGLFDEEFIICGSDVELCIRAYEKGYNNIYDSFVKLYHLESKSRDSYIPENDFVKSEITYRKYVANVDPYFNVNLSTESVIPTIRIRNEHTLNFENYIYRTKNDLLNVSNDKSIEEVKVSYQIPEIEPIRVRKSKENFSLRLNLLIPSVDAKHVFGGIATAINFFEKLQITCDCPARIIITDAVYVRSQSVISRKYVVVNHNHDSAKHFQITPFAYRHGETIPVSGGDVFLATAWWTAYAIQDIFSWQESEYGKSNPLIYLIQDYEPGFYPWSSRYLMADSTYRFRKDTYAIINSKQLFDFLRDKGYSFARTWFFEPRLNQTLASYLIGKDKVLKKKQILVYGRPGTMRNAFELIVYALREWVQIQEDAENWTIYSAGENFGDIDLGKNVKLITLGKLTLAEYASMLLDSYAGISLMVSPHPSYPPLEMAAFGVRTITNTYDNKDLSEFSNNIISLAGCNADSIAMTLKHFCDDYDGTGCIPELSDYTSCNEQFDEITNELSKLLGDEV